MQGVSKPSADSDIRFEVWLPQPAAWNRKFLSTGEGGFAGQLNYQRNGNDGAMDEILRRGYATASTDTGHRSADQWWAIGHPEKAADYLYRAKHVTTVAAKAIIAAYYGQPASRSYFSSCSNGGRQGLIEAQRYPDDFDGLIIGAPWNFQSHSNAGFIWDAQALAAPGARIPAEKLPAITAAVVAACDKNDGLADGLITDPSKCHFDPKSLICKGADGNNCLTPPQADGAAEDLRRSEESADGRIDLSRVRARFRIGLDRHGAADDGRVGSAGLLLEHRLSESRVGSADVQLRQRHDAHRSDGRADWGMRRPPTTRPRFGAASRSSSITAGTIRRCSRRTARSTTSRWRRRTAASRKRRSSTGCSWCRAWRIAAAASAHRTSVAWGSSSRPCATRRTICVTALEQWVERGVPPAQFIGTKFTDNEAATRTVQYTRPVCLYPAVPQYKGTGDPNDAANFACQR